MDDDFFVRAYEGGGRPAYHPKIMTKIVLYAYTQRWFSCRAMGQAFKENLPMMWLTAGQSPNFRTINRFRSERFQSVMEGLYAEMTHFLIEEGYVDLETYFLDGTKIEANANKYSFVWKKSTLFYEEKLQINIDETLEVIQEAIALDTEKGPVGAWLGWIMKKIADIACHHSPKKTIHQERAFETTSFTCQRP